MSMEHLIFTSADLHGCDTPEPETTMVKQMNKNPNYAWAYACASPAAPLFKFKIRVPLKVGSTSTDNSPRLGAYLQNFVSSIFCLNLAYAKIRYSQIFLTVFTKLSEQNLSKNLKTYGCSLSTHVVKSEIQNFGKISVT